MFVPDSFTLCSCFVLFSEAGPPPSRLHLPLSPRNSGPQMNGFFYSSVHMLDKMAVRTVFIPIRSGIRVFTAYVIMHLIIWDADTGKMLYEAERPMWKQDMQEDLIEKCRIIGVNKAHELVYWWRETHPNAFANVDCEWHKGSPS